ncbi:MAG: CIA30 family protein [Candidatus Promineifilaceae bacterium]
MHTKLSLLILLFSIGLLAACATELDQLEPIALVLPTNTLAKQVVAVDPSPTNRPITIAPTLTKSATSQVVNPTDTPQPTKTLMPTSTAPRANTQPPADDLILYDFASQATTRRWFIVNDSVMGGVSTSAATLSEQNELVFSGTVSLDNYGGFASLRAEPVVFETAGASALRMRVLGDGQTYHLQIRTDNRIDGVAYDQPFTTLDGEWSEIILPVADFLPQFRGRVLRNEPELDPALIRSLGIIITDKQVGPFKLLVDWISAIPSDLSISSQ